MSGVDDMLETLRRLAEAPARAAAIAAPLVGEAVKTTVRAGTDPMGLAWLPKKRGSGSPLANAANAISASAVGTVVRVQLAGVEVYHHLGLGHAPRRPILPDPGAIPPEVSRALDRAADLAFAQAVTL